MARMGDGYGSECHLLRFLGRHRARFDAEVRAVTGAAAVEWLDYPFDSGAAWRDGEWTGLNFLPADSPAQCAWRDFWPQSGNAPNWDAVGRIRMGEAWEWLLVEAKAHVGELRSSCKAQKNGGLPRIRAGMDATKAALGVPAEADWLDGHYQHANRLAVLWFLSQQDVPARLLFVYFYGDRFPNGAFECPRDADGWSDALTAQDRHLGLTGEHPLSKRVHKMFVPVAA